MSTPVVDRPGKTGVAELAEGITPESLHEVEAIAEAVLEGGTPERLPGVILDVDGVISPFGYTVLPEEGTAVDVDGIEYYIPDGMRQRLKRIARASEMMWCSAWEERANKYLLKLLDIPALPRIDLSRKLPPGARDDAKESWKMPYVREWYIAHPERSVVWIDDEIRKDAIAWASKYDNILLIVPEPQVGLTDEETDKVVIWLRDRVVDTSN